MTNALAVIEHKKNLFDSWWSALHAQPLDMNAECSKYPFIQNTKYEKYETLQIPHLLKT